MAIMEENTEDQGINLSGAFKNAKGEEVDLSGAFSSKPKSTKKTEPTAVPVKKKDQTKSVVPTTSVSKSVSAPTKPSLVLPSKEVEKPEEVGYVEDLWNRFKGSGTKVLSAFLNVPSAAQSYIYDVALAATGRDEEFNRLPAAVKKEVKNAVRAVNKGLPNGDFQYQTQEAANYLNKKAERIFERTIKDETSLSEEISKLSTNPTSEGVLKIINKSIRSTAESLPYMITSMVPGGAAAIGVATAAEKREQELEETGNYGMGFLINSAVTGGSNYLGEKYTGRILNKIGAKAIGNPELLKKVTQAPLKELGKDLGIEFTTGGLQSFTQEVSDKWTKGQDVQWIPTFQKALDDALLEAASVGTFAAGGKGVSVTRKLSEPLKKYLATKIIAKEDASYIKKGVEAIQDLNTQKADDQDPIVNEAIDNKIEEIKNNITGKLQTAENTIDNMSDEDIKKVIQIDRDAVDITAKAQAINDNPNMEASAKKLLLDDLKKQYINLKEQKSAIQEQAKTMPKVEIPTEGPVSFEYASESEIPLELKNIEPISKSEIDYGNGQKKIRLTYNANQLTPIKDAIQKQATSQIPVQPEAGVGGEMAEGITQAEPQGVTEEGKREEIEKRRQEELDKLPMVALSLTGELTEGQKRNAIEEAKINAKYDAELAALPVQEAKTEEVKAEEVKPEAGGMIQMTETQPTVEKVKSKEKIDEIENKRLNELVKLADERNLLSEEEQAKTASDFAKRRSEINSKYDSEIEELPTQVPTESEKLKMALDDLRKAKSVKYWMEPEFSSESNGQPKNDEPNGFTYDMVDTSEGKATIINTYDTDGKIAATMSILDVPSGDSPKGAFKISTREDVKKQGYASRLLDEATRMGYDIPSLIKYSFFGDNFSRFQT